MFSRIFKQNYMTKIALFSTASLIYWGSRKNQSEEIFQILHKQTQNSIVKFFLNGRIIGQGAILKNGFVVTSSEVFENQQPQITAQINGQLYNYEVLKVEEGIAILKIQQQKSQFNLSKYEIGQNAFVLGTDEQGLKDFQQCPITDSNFTLDIRLVGEEALNQTYPFILMNGCYSSPGSPVLNKNGQLIGIISGKFRNKTQVVPSTYFQGLENSNNIVKPYLGLTLKTSDQGGAFIIKINSDSPAEKAGLKLGEIIKSIDGVTIQHGKDVTKLLGVTENADSHVMVILRNGKERTIHVNLK
ncbi:unnamed protein product [Paramecium primaurelia]|uniref:PDZ domain-containing protein n=1 Tax=Paramecium primaurelia TaxID=5886 RepID=A0A8S1LQN4_PARPR|nr:unnamed protein product [Paramecium primaurelia]